MKRGVPGWWSTIVSMGGWYWALVIGGVVVAAVLNYAFALAGELRAHWMICEVLHLC